MNVLITGAGGFIGSHLVEAQLKKGNTVRALDLDLSALKSWGELPQLQRVKADIRHTPVVRQALQGVDVVFHLASAHLSVKVSEEEYWDINVHAAEKMLRLSASAGVGRFIHCSTVGVYGDVTQFPADEQSPCNPDLVYEKSKLAGEHAVLRASQESGYPVTIVRPAWVYGPHCPRTAKLFRAIRKGTFIMLGHGRTLRHCVYISDMVDALELCAQRKQAIGQSFIIGDNAAITIQELVNEIAEVLKTTPPKLRLPARLMAPVCAISERLFTVAGKEPLFSTRTLKFFTNNTSFDITKATTLLQFAPRVPLKEGLRRTYEQLQKNGQLN